jgi:CBS domain-containing protein
MHASDVMTRNVITVDPDTTVQDVAGLLSERGISGVPVVDATGQLVGIISEGDLLRRAEIGTDQPGSVRRSWWLEDFATARARDYVKSHGRTVRDIMSRDVVTVAAETDLGEIARLLETNRIKRVPVLQDGRIVGIVSRSNLVRALSAAPTPVPAATADSDRAIRSRLLTELDQQKWANRIWPQDVIVSDGTAHFWFTSDESSATMQAARIAAENIPGVRGVEVHIAPAPIVPHF